MSRLLFLTAFLIGCAAVIWTASNFVAANLLGLAVVAVIGAVYLIGSGELVQFRLATASLDRALRRLAASETPGQVELDQWLDSLSTTLRHAVQQRIEGQRTPLPAPVITPYLVSLLVMLGLLGTFAGLVGTLDGAVTALRGSTHLDAIREGLSAPIGGLSLAFGTSVAGVAASAMLGLMSALSRRDRLLCVHRLDRQARASLRAHSLPHQQQETLRALRIQAHGLPEVTQALGALTSQIGQMGERLSRQWLDGQERLVAAAQADYRALAGALQSAQHQQAEALRADFQHLGETLRTDIRALAESLRADHRDLTKNVQDALQDSLRASGRLAGEAIVPVVEGAMQRLHDEFSATNQTTHELVRHAADTHLASLGERFRHTADALLEGVKASHHESLVLLGGTLRDLCDAEARRGALALDHQQAFDATVKDHLIALGTALEAPLARLLDSGQQTQQTAADLLGRLRQEIAGHLERENCLLEERQHSLRNLEELSTALGRASQSQLNAVETLLERATTLLEKQGDRFGRQIEAQMARMLDSAETQALGATELASLAEAFRQAVDLYSQSNDRLIDSLDRIEISLNSASARSDEQLGFYVAQAREVIDHSLLSQREIFEELRKLGAPAMAEAD